MNMAVSMNESTQQLDTLVQASNVKNTDVTEPV